MENERNITSEIVELYDYISMDDEAYLDELMIGNLNYKMNQKLYDIKKGLELWRHDMILKTYLNKNIRSKFSSIKSIEHYYEQEIQRGVLKEKFGIDDITSPDLIQIMRTRTKVAQQIDIIDSSYSSSSEVKFRKEAKYGNLKRLFEEKFPKAIVRITIIDNSELLSASREVQFYVSKVNDKIFYLDSLSNFEDFSKDDVTVQSVVESKIDEFFQNITYDELYRSKEKISEVKEVYYKDGFFKNLSDPSSISFFKKCNDFLYEKSSETTTYIPVSHLEIDEAIKVIEDKYSSLPIKSTGFGKIFQFHVNCCTNRLKTNRINPVINELEIIEDFFGEDFANKVNELSSLIEPESKDLTIKVSKNVLDNFMYEGSDRNLNSQGYNLDTDTSDIEEFINFLSSETDEMKETFDESYGDLSYLIDSNLSPVLINEIHETSKNFLRNRKSSYYLTNLARIVRSMILSCTFNLPADCIKVSNCGLENTFLFTLPGNNLINVDQNRNFLLITKREAGNPDYGKNYTISGEYIINRFSFNRDALIHLRNVHLRMVSQSFFLVNDQKRRDSGLELNYEDIQHIFGVRVLIAITNSRTLSDWIINERYIQLGLGAELGGIASFIKEKMFFPARKNFSIFFVKRFIANLKGYSIELKERGIEYKNLKTFRSIRRLFSYGRTSGQEESIGNLYDGYLTSKNRMSVFHSIIKALEKLKETVNLHEKYKENDRYETMLRGYESEDLNVEEEFSLFKEMILFKGKFVAHRWYLRLCSENAFKRLGVSNRDFNSNFNLSEYLNPISDYATTKSSFKGVDESVLGLISKEIQDERNKIFRKERYFFYREGRAYTKKAYLKMVLDKRDYKDLTKEEKEQIGKDSISLAILENRTTTSFNIAELLKDIEDNGIKENISLLDVALNSIKLDDSQISTVAKDQYAGDREISILKITQRLKLRLIEIVAEQLSVFFPSDMIIRKGKFFSQASSIGRCQEFDLANMNEDGSSDYIKLYWNLDKTRWGPGLMMIHFYDVLYGMLKGKVPDSFLALINKILVDFHSKSICIPTKMIFAWLRTYEKDGFKYSYDDSMWQKEEMAFLEESNIFMKIFIGMMQGLLQQTSSLYHDVLCEHIKYLAEMYYDSEDIPYLDLLATSDDSIIIQLIKKDLLPRFVELTQYANKSFNLFDNTKKSNVHGSISELNQNFIIGKLETGVPIKFVGKYFDSLPSADYLDVVMHLSSQASSNFKKNVSISSQCFIMDLFVNDIKKTFNIKNKESFRYKNKVYERTQIPIALGGLPKFYPVSFSLSGFMYEYLDLLSDSTNVLVRDCLEMGPIIKNDEDIVFSFPKLRTGNAKTTKINLIRKDIRNKYISDDEYKEMSLSDQALKRKDQNKRARAVRTKNLIEYYTASLSDLVGQEIPIYAAENLRGLIGYFEDIKEIIASAPDKLDINKEIVRAEKLKNFIINNVGSPGEGKDEESEDFLKVYEMFKNYQFGVDYLHDSMVKYKKRKAKLLVLSKYFNKESFKMLDKKNDVRTQLLLAGLKKKSFYSSTEPEFVDFLYRKNGDFENKVYSGFDEAVREGLKEIEELSTDDLGPHSPDGVLKSRIPIDYEVADFFITLERNVKVPSNYNPSPMTVVKLTKLRNPLYSPKTNYPTLRILSHFWFGEKIRKGDEDLFEADFSILKILHPFLDKDLDLVKRNLGTDDHSVILSKIKELGDETHNLGYEIYTDFKRIGSLKDIDSFSNFFLQNYQSNLVKGRDYFSTVSSTDFKVQLSDTVTKAKRLANSFITGRFYAASKGDFETQFFKEYESEIWRVKRRFEDISIENLYGSYKNILFLLLFYHPTEILDRIKRRKVQPIPNIKRFLVPQKISEDGTYDKKTPFLYFEKNNNGYFIIDFIQTSRFFSSSKVKFPEFVRKFLNDQDMLLSDLVCAFYTSLGREEDAEKALRDISLRTKTPSNDLVFKRLELIDLSDVSKRNDLVVKTNVFYFDKTDLSLNVGVRILNSVFRIASVLNYSYDFDTSYKLTKPIEAIYGETLDQLSEKNKLFYYNEENCIDYFFSNLFQATQFSRKSFDGKEVGKVEQATFKDSFNFRLTVKNLKKIYYKERKSSQILNKSRLPESVNVFRKSKITRMIEEVQAGGVNELREREELFKLVDSFKESESDEEDSSVPRSFSDSAFDDEDYDESAEMEENTTGFIHLLNPEVVDAVLNSFEFYKTFKAISNGKDELGVIIKRYSNVELWTEEEISKVNRGKEVTRVNYGYLLNLTSSIIAGSLSVFENLYEEVSRDIGAARVKYKDSSYIINQARQSGVSASSYQMALHEVVDLVQNISEQTIINDSIKLNNLREASSGMLSSFLINGNPRSLNMDRVIKISLNTLSNSRKKLFTIIEEGLDMTPFAMVALRRYYGQVYADVDYSSLESYVYSVFLRCKDFVFFKHVISLGKYENNEIESLDVSLLTKEEGLANLVFTEAKYLKSLEKDELERTLYDIGF